MLENCNCQSAFFSFAFLQSRKCKSVGEKERRREGEKEQKKRCFAFFMWPYYKWKWTTIFLRARTASERLPTYGGGSECCRRKSKNKLWVQVTLAILHSCSAILCMTMHEASISYRKSSHPRIYENISTNNYWKNVQTYEYLALVFIICLHIL